MKTFVTTYKHNDKTHLHIVVGHNPEDVRHQLWDYLKNAIPDIPTRTDLLKGAQVTEIERDCEGVAFEWDIPMIPAEVQQLLRQSREEMDRATEALRISNLSVEQLEEEVSVLEDTVKELRENDDRPVQSCTHEDDIPF